MRGFIVGSIATGLLLLGLMELGGDTRTSSHVAGTASDSGVMAASVLGGPNQGAQREHA
jgi:hypothetical protein